MSINFSILGVSSEIENILRQNGITEPTPIQSQAIPEILVGKDVIGQAQTGTGKTLAFNLPIMEKIDVTKSSVQALVITPTRELALQITHEAKKLAKVKGVNILAAYGGQDVERQAKKLKGTIHMVIGTPGRLLDHLRRRTINFNELQILVLDEADQMLDMGFLKDIEQILHQVSKERQTMLFSATISRQIRSLASRYMRDPVEIHVKGKKITLDEIKQTIIETTDRSKQDVLIKAIDEYMPFMAIIFCRTKRRASALNEALQSHGYNSDELHGDLTQAKREKVMKAFRNAEIQLLIATDVAARGLDIEGITHIFNYDVPQDTESYIHRIGRTGRAGQTGMAITLATPRDEDILRLIEKGIGLTLSRRKIVVKTEQSLSKDSQVRDKYAANNKRDNVRRYSDRKPGGIKRRDTSKGRQRKNIGQR
ncbi:MAG: DEAD/DEAH box helicase [Clostridia bacterium]